LVLLRGLSSVLPVCPTVPRGMEAGDPHATLQTSPKFPGVIVVFGDNERSEETWPGNALSGSADHHSRGKPRRAGAGQSLCCREEPARGMAGASEPASGPTLSQSSRRQAGGGRLCVRHYSDLRPQATDGYEDCASPQQANVSLDIYGHTGIRRGDFTIPCSIPLLRL
jgi:hypothetical protein